MAEVEYVYERPKEDLPKQKKSHKKLIIAIIAIIVILIAAYLLYTYENMMQQFGIQSITYTGDTLRVSIINVGGNDIDVSLISALIDNSNKNIVGNTGTISPGEIASFNVTSASGSCNKVLVLRLPSGTMDSSSIVCDV